MKCWICGEFSSSGEHMVKRSDLKAQFGKRSQKAPIFMHNANFRNTKVSSLKSDKLKSPGRLCAHCNNTRTQPYDRAWETLSAELRKRLPLETGASVRANKVFSTAAQQRMLGVHLFFVKLFGCHIAAHGIDIPLAPLADAIRSNRAHPNIYLRFGQWPLGDTAGMSDIQIAQLEGDTKIASWFYTTGFLGVNVMFAVDGIQPNGLVGSWHPKHGTTKLTIVALS